MIPEISPLTPGTLLSAPPGERYHLDRRLWGFGGVHGGLSVALLTVAMAELRPAGALRGVTAIFHRSVTGEFTVSATPVRVGRSISTFAARAVSGDEVAVAATGLFCAAPAGSFPTLSPPPPAVPPPADCDVFPILVEHVPVGEFVQIRPVDEHRPLAGEDRPDLTAWVRFTEDDLAPDLPRLLCLIDVLPPSYYSMVDRLYLIPTVELSIRLSDGVPAVPSPWVLLQATTTAVDSSGLLQERVDAWARDGTYLGTATQLRLARAV